MLSEELRRRLEALNRGRLAVRPRLDELDGTDAPSRARASPKRLEGLFAGVEVRHGAAACYVIRRRLSDEWPASTAVAERFARLAEDNAPGTARAHLAPALAEFLRTPPEARVFLDIETCGFAGMPVFLIGLLRFGDGDFGLEQLFARHYGEEPAILRRLADSLGEADLLVTFNGKSFDWPCLCDRAAVHRVPLRRDRRHCDLLHEARRAWGGSLPDCRLQTLEAHRCGRRRVADIPGSAIPDAYHRFVQTGDGRWVREVIRHNALDLLTLAELSIHLLS